MKKNTRTPHEKELNKHPVQVSRLDVPRWLPPLIILLEVPARPQIMSPRLINGNVLYHGHKETLSLVIFGKIDNPH